MYITPNPPISLAIAIGIGLLIGSERERRKGSGSQRGAAGVRTFALAALAGALSSYLNSEALLVAVAAGAVLLSALVYRYTAPKDPGLTTEFALLVTVLLGALTMRNPLLAAGLSVITTILLAARERLHRALKNLLSEQEAHDALVFLAATLVILPLPEPRTWTVWGVQPQENLGARSPSDGGWRGELYRIAGVGISPGARTSWICGRVHIRQRYHRIDGQSYKAES